MHYTGNTIAMKKVIIAEDIKAILEKEQSFLSRAGIRIFTAATNERALSLHRDEKADLIIAKLDTPGMSGEMLCSLIRDDEELRNVSLIMVCSASEADLERCVQCSANVFISSPINSAVLLQEAHQLLHIAPRTSCRISMSVKLEGRSKGIPFIGSLENISTSGMLFRTAALLSEGDTVQCSFSLPDSTRITANAEIMRVLGKEAGQDTNRYGIRFTDPGVDLISAIEALVEKECQYT